MKKINKHAVIFIFAILVITVSFSVFVFSKSERFNLWILVMLFPAFIGMIINGIRFKSVRKVLEPITGRINLKSIGFAIAFPLIFLGILALALYVTGLVKLSTSESSATSLPTLSIFQFLMILPANFVLMFGEEYGWRGFLLKELSKQRGKIFSTIVVGIVWSLYHAPIVYGLARHHSLDHPLMFCAVQMAAVFVLSFPFAHAYFLTGNILPPMLLHFLWNIVNPVLLGNIYTGKPGILEGKSILINGEGLAGILAGSVFMIWYIKRTRIEAGSGE